MMKGINFIKKAFNIRDNVSYRDMKKTDEEFFPSVLKSGQKTMLAQSVHFILDNEYVELFKVTPSLYELDGPGKYTKTSIGKCIRDVIKQHSDNIKFVCIVIADKEKKELIALEYKREFKAISNFAF